MCDLVLPQAALNVVRTGAVIARVGGSLAISNRDALTALSIHRATTKVGETAINEVPKVFISHKIRK